MSLGCSISADCIQISQSLNLSHIAVGLVVALLSFSFYLLLFHRGSDDILSRLDAAQRMDVRKIRLDTLSLVLDPSERKVLSTIVAAEGITQHMVGVRCDLSKAKVSQIVSSFEKKGLIARTPKGKSYALFLKKEI